MSVVPYINSFSLDISDQTPACPTVDNIWRGTSRQLQVTVRDDGVALNLTGGLTASTDEFDRGLFYLKKATTHTDEQTLSSGSGFIITASMFTGSAGVMKFDVPATSSSIAAGTYFYDMVLIRSGSSPKVVYPLAIGKLRIVDKPGDPLWYSQS